MPRQKRIKRPNVGNSLEEILSSILAEIESRDGLEELTTKELFSMLVSLTRLRLALTKSNTEDVADTDTFSGSGIDDSLSDLHNQVLSRRGFTPTNE